MPVLDQNSLLRKTEKRQKVKEVSDLGVIGRVRPSWRFHGDAIQLEAEVNLTGCVIGG